MEKLITLHKKVKARGGMLKLSNLRRELRQIFAVTRLDRLFEIEPDEGHALAALHRVPLDLSDAIPQLAQRVA